MTIDHKQKVNESRQKFLNEYKMLKIFMNKKLMAKSSVDNISFFIKLKRAFGARP